MLKRHLIVISFDALHTLIDLPGGCGLQYRIPFEQYVKSKLAIDINKTLPSATVANMERVANDAIHQHICADRIAWHHAHPTNSVKEMPIGGLTQESVFSFWSRVLNTVYSHPLLYKDAEESVVAQIHKIMQHSANKESPFSYNNNNNNNTNDVSEDDHVAIMNDPKNENRQSKVECDLINNDCNNSNNKSDINKNEREEKCEEMMKMMNRNDSKVYALKDWDAFLHYIVDDVFTSPVTLPWLKEGKRTLEELRKWNVEQELRIFKSELKEINSSESATCASSARGNNSTYKVPVLAFAPYVVTNMDERVRTIFARLGAFDIPEVKCNDKEKTNIKEAIDAIDLIIRRNADEKNSDFDNSYNVLSIANKQFNKALQQINDRIKLETKPLISNVVTAADVEYAKPSAKGLLHCASLANIKFEDMNNRYIHVGDTEADKLACAAADCLYVQCDCATGIKWEHLHEKLMKLEESINRAPNGGKNYRVVKKPTAFDVFVHFFLLSFITVLILNYIYNKIINTEYNLFKAYIFPVSK